MHRFIPYTILFAATLLVQIFLLDHLTISLYFAPMVYLTFVLMLPLDTPGIGLLAAGFATGWIMDHTMGTAGLNLIATMPVAFLRPWIIGLIYTRENPHEGGIPSPGRFGKLKFLRYIVVCVLLHHLLFFGFESLSLTHIGRTALRLLISGAASIYLTWLAARLFTLNTGTRLV